MIATKFLVGQLYLFTDTANVIWWHSMIIKLCFCCWKKSALFSPKTQINIFLSVGRLVGEHLPMWWHDLTQRANWSPQFYRIWYMIYLHSLYSVEHPSDLQGPSTWQQCTGRTTGELDESKRAKESQSISIRCKRFLKTLNLNIKIFPDLSGICSD